MLNYQGRKKPLVFSTKSCGHHGNECDWEKFLYWIAGKPQGKKKERKKRQSLSPQTKAPGPGHKKTAGENFALWLHI